MEVKSSIYVELIELIELIDVIKKMMSDYYLNNKVFVPEICTINKGRSINMDEVKNRKSNLHSADIKELAHPHDLSGLGGRDDILFTGEFSSEPISHNMIRPKTELTELPLLQTEKIIKTFNSTAEHVLLSDEERDVIKKYSDQEYNKWILSLGLDEVHQDSWIQTFSGKRFYPLYPYDAAIIIEDIAKSLSQQCRFTGHCRFHYSIAQHSVAVSYLCDPKYALQGLLHDGSETYISDIASPIKRLPEFSQYKEIEKNIQRCVYKRFGCPSEEHPSVKQADTLMLVTEATSLLPNIDPEWELSVKPLPFEIKKMTPEEAEKLFLDRFYELR